MSEIRMELPFGEENFIERKEVYNPAYGSVIEKPENSHVVYICTKTGKKAKLTALDGKLRGNVLNPKPKFPASLKLIKNPFDKNDYVIYFIDASSIKCKNGGNTECKNKDIPELQSVKYFYQYEYEFNVVDPIDFLELLDCKTNNIGRDYFKKKINGMIDSVIKDQVSKAINEYGMEKFDEHSNEIIEYINELLVEKTTRYGFQVRLLGVSPTEDPKINAVKENTQLYKYQKRMSKEN